MVKIITFSSSRYPSIQLPGLPLMAIGAEYTVSDQDLAVIKSRLSGFSPAIQRSLSLSVRDPKAGETLPITISKPGTKLVTEADSPTTEPAEPMADSTIPEPIKLTSDDLELVQIEVGKVADKTTATDQKRLIQNLVENPDIGTVFRVAYLEAIAKADGIKATAVTFAQEQLLEINPAE